LRSEVITVIAIGPRGLRCSLGKGNCRLRHNDHTVYAIEVMRVMKVIEVAWIMNVTEVLSVTM